METYSTSKTQSWLTWFLRGFLILGFLILMGRLFELQIVKGEYFRSLSEGNRIRRVPITAARGNIIARGGDLTGFVNGETHTVTKPNSALVIGTSTY